MAEPITILMPCRAQAREFFDGAVRSVVAQASPEWRLVVIVDADSPSELAEWIAAPALANGIVKIPILFDDYAMFREGEPFERWREKALAAIDAHDVTVAHARWT